MTGATIVVAGTAGGVGTTTVAALVSLVARPVALLDHTAGQLEVRGAITDATSVTGLVVHDLGAHISGAGLSALTAPGAIPVVVTAATTAGLTDAAAALRALQSSAPVLVTVETFGRHDTTAGLRALRQEFERLTIIELPRDRALAPGGPIAPQRTSLRTRHAIEQLVARLTAARRTGGAV